jgi:hypothetical protein
MSIIITIKGQILAILNRNPLKQLILLSERTAKNPDNHKNISTL